MYFHPLLQKQLIARLLAFFEEAKVFAENTVQVILTSNSPFCLSDIPRDNMILLQAGEDGRCGVLAGERVSTQTLGASIPDLLAEEFFMGYSTMGDFARERIRSLVGWLKRGSPDAPSGAWLTPTVAWRLIQAVGEPLLRKRLEELYGRVADQQRDEDMLRHYASRQGSNEADGSGGRRP